MNNLFLFLFFQILIQFHLVFICNILFFNVSVLFCYLIFMPSPIFNYSLLVFEELSHWDCQDKRKFNLPNQAENSLGPLACHKHKFHYSLFILDDTCNFAIIPFNRLKNPKFLSDSRSADLDAGQHGGRRVIRAVDARTGWRSRTGESVRWWTHPHKGVNFSYFLRALLCWIFWRWILSLGSLSLTDCKMKLNDFLIGTCSQ